MIILPILGRNIGGARITISFDPLVILIFCLIFPVFIILSQHCYNDAMKKAKCVLLVALMVSVSNSVWGTTVPGQPANSWVYKGQWYCNNGFKKEDDHCVSIKAPANSWVYKDRWYCNNGFKKQENYCVSIRAPANSWVYKDQWYCNNGFKKQENHCVSIEAPANSWVYKDQWYCNNGFKRQGNQCLNSVGAFAGIVESPQISTKGAPTNASGLPDCPSSRTAPWTNCFGSYVFDSGGKYVGEWKDDKFSGQGAYRFPDGDTYLGEYKDNRRHGQGTYTFADGEKYVGEFKDGKYSGQGTLTYVDGNKYTGEYRDDKKHGKGIFIFANGNQYIGEFKDGKYNGQGTFIFADGREEMEGFWKDNKFQYAKDLKPINSDTEMALSTTIQTQTSKSAELLAAQRKAEELEQQLAALKARQQQHQHAISLDTQIPLIKIVSANTVGKRGIVKGKATDNTGIAEVTVDGTVVPVNTAGAFEYSTFVPNAGLSVIIQATDLAGLSSIMSVTLERSAIVEKATIKFDRLNPLGKEAMQNKDALALIIGIGSYENTIAAKYADSDALMFKDYASEKLGVPEERIKTLVNSEADIAEILLSIKKWLRRSTKPDRSDIYVFFAGHGLAAPDGQAYLIPFDGRPELELLERTALLKKELFEEIATARPRNVTVFLDACYTGKTRTGEVLLADANYRPLVLKAMDDGLPANFTVMTASSGSEFSGPLEEVKQGMFSYFLMKGMEGEADINQDNTITASELYAYVKRNVEQHSSGSQTPELKGDADRELVKFQ